MNRRQWGKNLFHLTSVIALSSFGCHPKSSEQIDAMKTRSDANVHPENAALGEANAENTSSIHPRLSEPSAVAGAELPTWAAGHDWPLVRGDRQATGVAWTTLPEKLQPIWTYECQEDIFAQTPVLCQNRLYVGSADSHLIALDATDGKVLWKSATELGFTASPAILPAVSQSSPSLANPSTPNTLNLPRESGVESVLIAGDAVGVIRRYDPADGHVLWNFTTDGEIDSSPTFLRKEWLPELAEDATLVGSQDGYLYCLAISDGKMLWKYQNPDQIRCFPTVIGDRIFVAGCDGALHQLDAVRGTLLRSTPLEAPTGNAPAVLDSLLFVGTEGRKLLAIDWRKGEIAWKYPSNDEAVSASIRSSVAIRSDLGVVATQNKTVHGFLPQSGEIVWQTSVRSRLEASPVLCENRIYLGGMDGRLYILDAFTGKLLHDDTLGGRIAAAVAIADGRLFVGNDNGQLFCLG